MSPGGISFPRIQTLTITASIRFPSLAFPFFIQMDNKQMSADYVPDINTSIKNIGVFEPMEATGSKVPDALSLELDHESKVEAFHTLDPFLKFGLRAAGKLFDDK